MEDTRQDAHAERLCDHLWLPVQATHETASFSLAVVLPTSELTAPETWLPRTPALFQSALYTKEEPDEGCKEDNRKSDRQGAADSDMLYSDEGFPITKAMLKPREREGIGIFWFSTNTSSNKVKFFRQNPKASIYFVDRRFFRGVSLVGTVEVLETPEAKERLWQRGDEQYYHEGVADPDYCVLRFIAQKGRYYSNFKSEDFVVDSSL